MTGVEFDVIFDDGGDFNVSFDQGENMEMGFDEEIVVRNGGGGAVNSVNGKTGDVVLDAGDLAYDDNETYSSGTVGDEISDLKADLSGKYSLPSGGIPSSDMASAVQTSLGKADAAIPAPSSPTSGQFLKWNGSAWIASDLPVYSGGVS